MNFETKKIRFFTWKVFKFDLLKTKSYRKNFNFFFHRIEYKIIFYSFVLALRHPAYIMD